MLFLNLSLANYSSKSFTRIKSQNKNVYERCFNITLNNKEPIS